MKLLRILLLEDSPIDYELIQMYLSEGEIQAEVMRVETETDFLNALVNAQLDLILSDYSLPAFDGITALELAQGICPDLPFIFVSATLGEELAIETLKKGATDYVLKQRLERLAPAVNRALRESEERVRRRRGRGRITQIGTRVRTKSTGKNCSVRRS
jgi:CheY-like chemotaxis protein